MDRDTLTVLPASWLICHGLQCLLSATVSGTHSVLNVDRDRSILSPFSIGILKLPYVLISFTASTVRTFKADILYALTLRQIFPLHMYNWGCFIYCVLYFITFSDSHIGHRARAVFIIASAVCTARILILEVVSYKTLI